MKITIESTSQLVTLVKGRSEIPARVWEGQTDTGIKVICLVTRIAARDNQDLSQFEKELQEQARPTTDSLQCFPLRLII